MRIFNIRNYQTIANQKMRYNNQFKKVLKIQIISKTYQVAKKVKIRIKLMSYQMKICLQVVKQVYIKQICKEIILILINQYHLLILIIY